MRPIQTRALTVLAASAAMLLGACSTDSNAPATTVGGKSSKGIVIGGVVNAYALTDTAKSTPLAVPATTGSDGSYELQLNSSYVPGTALLVEITATTGTQMKCDLPVCGQGVSFGQLYNLPTGFAMSAALPSATGTVTTNITPLTHAAAQTASARIAAGASPSAATLAANAQLAGRLGISGSLVDQPIVDLTDASAVNVATQDQLEYNLKSAGVIAALQADNQGAAVEDLVNAFAAQFAGGGLADTETTESSSVTVEELLEGALAILDEVKSNPDVNQDEGSAVAQTETEVAAEETDAQNNGSTEVSQGEVPDDVQDAGLLAAKAFVAQVRDILNASSLPTANQDAFAAEIDLATGVVDSNVDPVAKGLGAALAAIADAFEQVHMALGDEDPTTTPPTSTQFEAVTVSITEEAGAYTYSVAQDLVVDTSEEQADGTLLVSSVTVALDLAATDDNSVISVDETDTNDGTSGSYTDDVDVTADLVVAGSASSDVLSLAIQEGSQLLASFVLHEEGSETQSETVDGGSGNSSHQGTMTLSSIDADLIVELAQLVAAEAGGSTFTFTGSFGLSIDSASVAVNGSNSWQYGSTGYSGDDDESETFEIGALNLTLSGTVASSEGESLDLSAAIALGNVNATCTYSFDYSYDNSTFAYSENETDVCQETAGAADVSITVIFEAALEGVADDIQVTVSAARSGLRTGTLDLDLLYGGKQLNFDYSHPDMDAADYDGTLQLTVTNHNGVQLVVTAVDVNSESDTTTASGVITSGGKKQADVHETSDGAVLVRYIDGTTESFI